MSFQKVLTIFVLLLFCADAKENAHDESDKGPHYDQQEYDFYDEEGEHGSSGDMSNYSYAYQDYGNGTENIESELDFVPELISQSQTIIAKPGDTIQLPCKASDSAVFVRIWMKDETMLFTGNVKYSREAALARFHLDPLDNTTLVIDDLSANAAGIYTCRIMVRERDIISLTHYVTVSDSFNIQPVPPDGLITISEGDNVTLSCFVSGADISQDSKPLRWTREGVAFPNGNYSISDVQYKIVNATKNDAGFYFCTASSDKGESRSAEIEVRVQFAPSVVSLQKTIIRSGRGIMVEFACLVTGEPSPKVSWYKGDEVLSLTGRVDAHRAGSHHLLVIHRVRSDDTATYMCYAINDLGSGQKTILFETHDLQDENFDSEIPPKTSSIDLSDLTRKYNQLAISLSEDKKEMQSFQKRCEGDITSLKNLTLNVLYSVKNTDLNESNQSPQTSFDVSLFADIERLTQEMRQFQSNFGQSVRELTDFKRTSSEDMERLWDQVNEVQELTNVTSRNLDEIYDRDILALQNFRTTVQQEMSKLRGEIATFLASTPTPSSLQIRKTTFDTNTDEEEGYHNKVELLESELIRLRNSIAKTEDSQILHREEILRVFRDVDSLKKQQQAMEREQLKLQRDIQRLESEDLADISNKMKSYDRKFEDLDQFQLSTDKALSEGSNAGDEKYSLVVAEMQKLKNQIFYLQQSYIQLRVGSSSNNELANIIKLPAPKPAVPYREESNSIALDERITLLQKDLKSCVSRERVDKLAQSLSEREAQLSNELQQVKDKLQLVQEVSRSIETGIQDTNTRVNRNNRRIENLEVNSRKYNLIISGLSSERKLERHAHLEKVVGDFLKDTLGLEEVPFDEAERIADPSGEWIKPIRVKFPNVRTKVNVLQASRESAIVKVLRESNISIVEDFTNAVKYRRRRLAAFARQRARAKKLKWALKNDELFFNGKVFVFSEQENKVVLKQVQNKEKRPNEYE